MGSCTTAVSGGDIYTTPTNNGQHVCVDSKVHKQHFLAVKTLLALIGTLFLCGCATGLRVSAPPQEVFTTFTVAHQQSAGQAFLNVERALAESYNDLPAVLKLRQPETGTLLVRSLVPYRVGGFYRPN